MPLNSYFNFSVKRKLKVIRKYNCEAEVYDELHFEEQFKKYSLMKGFVALRESDVCLDCGCGTGLLITQLLNKPKLIVGVDFSIGMLKKAKEKFKGESKVELVLADVNFLPFINEVFDNVFSFTVIEGKINGVKALKEIHRVAKRDSLVILSILKEALNISKLKATIKENKFKIVNEALTNLSSKDYLFILQKT
ncbi:class I SAM-dependent methyltransferase [Candidatus Bathyarchaeota archaeon]|nr:class I SAM-dependent methyltransferase [Candidatus Bathyarchaeota archaeon]